MEYIADVDEYLNHFNITKNLVKVLSLFTFNTLSRYVFTKYFCNIFAANTFFSSKAPPGNIQHLFLHHQTKFEEDWMKND